MTSGMASPQSIDLVGSLDGGVKHKYGNHDVCHLKFLKRTADLFSSAAVTTTRRYYKTNAAYTPNTTTSCDGGGESSLSMSDKNTPFSSKTYSSQSGDTKETPGITKSSTKRLPPGENIANQQLEENITGGGCSPVNFYVANYNEALLLSACGKSNAEDLEDVDVMRRKQLQEYLADHRRLRICCKCGSSFATSFGSSKPTTRVKYRLKSKARTSALVLRLLKKKKTKFNASGTKLSYHVLTHYFSSSNKLTQTCGVCMYTSIAATGEKRNDLTFVDRHSAHRSRAKHQKRLERRLAAENVRDSATPKSVKGKGSRIQSPMQAFKVDANVQKSSTTPKPVVRTQIVAKTSSSIIRKFQKDQVSRLLKADQKGSTSQSASKSSLSSFLDSIK